MHVKQPRECGIFCSPLIAFRYNERSQSDQFHRVYQSGNTPHGAPVPFQFSVLFGVWSGILELFRYVHWTAAVKALCLETKWFATRSPFCLFWYPHRRTYIFGNKTATLCRKSSAETQRKLHCHPLAPLAALSGIQFAQVQATTMTKTDQEPPPLTTQYILHFICVVFYFSLPSYCATFNWIISPSSG